MSNERLKVYLYKSLTLDGTSYCYKIENPHNEGRMSKIKRLAESITDLADKYKNELELIFYIPETEKNTLSINSHSKSFCILQNLSSEEITTLSKDITKLL